MTDLAFNPAVWMLAAMVILGIEMLISGFDYVGLSVGAVWTAIMLLLVGDVVTASPFAEAIIFVFLAVTSLVSWMLIRRLAGVRPGQDKRITHDINED